MNNCPNFAVILEMTFKRIVYNLAVTVLVFVLVIGWKLVT